MPLVNRKLKAIHFSSASLNKKLLHLDPFRHRRHPGEGDDARATAAAPVRSGRT